MTKILIIEDDDNIREAIMDTLKFAGYDVFEAADGVEGIQIAKEIVPDLILCDVMMPEIDGYDVLIALNQIPQLAQIPFVFVTAKSTIEDVRRGMVMGADDYLTKPFTSDELLATIQSRLERHTRLQKYNLKQIEMTRQFINFALPHELRTPAGGISIALYMLERGLNENKIEVAHKYLDVAKRSAKRLNHLIANFTTHAHLQLINNDPDLLRELQGSTLEDISLIAKQVAETESVEQDRIADVDINVERGSVIIHLEHAVKLLQEIVNNAFKFSGEGTPVTIYGKREDDYYVLSVANEGHGMTAEQIADIKATFQFDRDVIEQQGSGLGLAIAKLILDIYSGELHIESEPPKMTTVTIRLRAA